ncbi:hypothetical protein H7H78_12365 [Mycobacterium shinjukuense]|uniref:Uncharacterized protein n=1 Tax=Mycobacterium shinjukuense TaxID=398694 RepID=A0A7I7MTX1_9MYCO|nr:hypothetical protein [Mycobacterium shinjukuense]MCV6986197.1 hypothetical protein [Mycobacterium shinjukuense]ORB72282.1 hypothetical protein BST45_00325 [Mycobacterium shinjukuense]BBX75307.1 hypothetical protein MSHI_32130 [Mycobacterium shinjukuense]
MNTETSQRGPRNSSGEILRRLDRGQCFAATRCGVPVGEPTLAMRPAKRSPPTAERLPAHLAPSALTMAKPAHATGDGDERSNVDDVIEHLVDVVGV